MAFEPGESHPSETISFRLGTAHCAWLRSFVKKGRTISAVGAWGMELGHEYYDVLKDQYDWVASAAAAEGVSRATMVGKLLALGREVHEKERKGRK